MGSYKKHILGKSTSIYQVSLRDVLKYFSCIENSTFKMSLGNEWMQQWNITADME